MKREYVKPVFVAESYSFNDTIAQCEYHVDPNKPIEIGLDTPLCKVKDGGHSLGGVHDYEGNIAKNYFGATDKEHPIPEGTIITLFNDGSEKNACLFDWAGPKAQIIDAAGNEYGQFAQAIFGNKAGEGNHAPAYEGGFMFS